MYGILSVIFVLIAAFGYYKIITYTQEPYLISQIKLSRHVTNQNYNVFGTCIDKKVLSQYHFAQLKLKFHTQNNFVVMFKHNPLLQCQQLTQLLNINFINSHQTQIKIEEISSIPTFISQYEIKKIQSNSFLKIKNEKLFILILSVDEIKIEQQKYKLGHQDTNTIVLAIENIQYSKQILKPLFWFGWFNLIGISLISYYRKNVFNTKIKLLSPISLLVYLMWIGFDQILSLQEIQQKIKLAMNIFILIICIKNKLSFIQTSLIVIFSFVNHLCLNMEFNSQTLWMVFAVNILNSISIAFGQNIEIVYFSMFSYIVQYGLVNKSVDILHPFILSLILTTLVFGPTIYQLLQLQQEFQIQSQRTQQRLKSYQISQNDNLLKI